MRRIMFALAVMLGVAGANAGVQTKTVVYECGGTKLVGFLAWDDAVATEKTPAPGVVVCPEWWGNNDYAHERAKMAASLGYVAFAIDMYGEASPGAARVTTDPKQAGEWSGGVMKDRELRRARALAGYKTLLDQPMVDRTRVAAIGYCMGGTVALELARTGADLRAVVTFHASRISADDAMDNKNIKASLLICNGQDDGFVPPEEIAAFHAQMKEAGVDYEFASYAGAVHSFTNKGADAFNIPGVKYNAAADRRSWENMKSFLAERLAPGAAGADKVNAKN